MVHRLMSWTLICANFGLDKNYIREGRAVESDGTFWTYMAAARILQREGEVIWLYRSITALGHCLVMSGPGSM